MNMTQCRMARAALKWSTTKLAEEAGVSPMTVNRFENGKDSYTSTAKKLQDALESTSRVRFEGETCVCLVNEKDKSDSESN